MRPDLSKHPCFNAEIRHRFERIHLPIAAGCNVQCNFCDRKYSCVNESRPGVTSSILTPEQALRYYQKAKELRPNLTVAGIAGPGDPFDDPEGTLETLRLIRKEDPQAILCVATNGLNVLEWVEDLALLDVSHVTLTINAVDPEIGAKIYRWIRYQKRVYRGLEAGVLMMARQLAAVEAIKNAGLLLKVNCIVMPTINDAHVPRVAEVLAAKGADVFNCMTLCRVPETPFYDLPVLLDAHVADIRRKAAAYIPQMNHCARCRADAVGRIGQEMDLDMLCCLQRAARGIDIAEEQRPYVAVASMEGVLVNQHLGDAGGLWVYEQDGRGGFKLAERRLAPVPGGGNRRWAELARLLEDCRAVLCSGAGDSPRVVMGRLGVPVMVTEGLLDEALTAVYAGVALPKPRAAFKCGVGCAGDGTGCG